MISDPNILAAVMEQIDGALGATDRRPVVIGLCGAQGSGKTTLAGDVLATCAAQGLRCAQLSIDDLYLTRRERAELARRVNPLLATRGVPGTHDVALGRAVLASLDRGEACRLPRFDKARDDRASAEDWETAPARCEVLVFEGWCVGARAQDPASLADPVNALEREEDADATWRGYANTALAGVYAELFDRLDRLVLLAAPDFSVVAQWRQQQEQDLAARSPAASQVMDAASIERFVRHYERLTRHILIEMPGRADLVVRLDRRRHPIAITSRW